MDRTDLEAWLAHHPDSTRMPPAELLDRCEEEVRDHARQDAWLRACDVAESSVKRFERVFGLPASDSFVTREVCHEIARELKQHEPHPDDETAEHWVDDEVLASLDDEARGRLREWLHDLAEKEEHEAWMGIVYFADHLARRLIREAHMTNAVDWDFDRTYPRVAARVARMMIREFQMRADMLPVEGKDEAVH